MYQAKRDSIKRQQSNDAQQFNAVILIGSLVVFHMLGLAVFGIISGV